MVITKIYFKVFKKYFIIIKQVLIAIDMIIKIRKELIIINY